VVYTKPWVVDLILNLVGYTSDQPLNERLVVEPAAGEGSFLLPLVRRLIESCRRRAVPIVTCLSSVVAYEVDDASAALARAALVDLLCLQGTNLCDSELLADSWVRTGDYLMEAGDLAGRADYVVGNPPYIRLEDLERGGAMYRAAYPTMVGRADIYIAFFEAALRHLRPGGACGYICADRWMLNQYGAELRRFITKRFNVEAVIQMHHAAAFDVEVSAYPAVTVIRNAEQGPVVVATLDPNAEKIGAAALAAEFRPNAIDELRTTNAAVIEHWFDGSDPWPLVEPERLTLLRRLESQFRHLEVTGVTVGIGVATGADKVFITKDPELVERERLLPLAMAFDVKDSSVNWSGNYLVNPWNGNGLVDLSDYPRLASYLSQHRNQLLGRHVGQKAPANWFRTIDRVNDRVTTMRKLYLPDFNGRISPVLDVGRTFPHHNLYFIVADIWDMEVLGGLLLSDVAQFFIEAYCVRMRGGYLRFQAQYLRRIRVPEPHSITLDQSQRLRLAFSSRDVNLANDVANELYKLSPREGAIIGARESTS